MTHATHGFCGTSGALASLVDEAFPIGAHHVEIVHGSAGRRSGAVPRRLGFTGIERRSPPQDPVTPAEEGIDVIWRLRASERWCPMWMFLGMSAPNNEHVPSGRVWAA
jgi:hypothetical protein